MEFVLYDINHLSDLEYNKWLSLMSDEKRDRINLLRSVRDKKLSVCGEMLAKTLISKCTGIDTKDIDFSQNKFGKPYAQNIDINFNISHSGDMVVCAADKNPIGVDIEKMRPVFSKTAERCFNDIELDYIFNSHKFGAKNTKITDRRTLMRFFEIWTKREAMAKCSGKGILRHNFDKKYKTTTIFLSDYIISIAK